MKLLIETRNLWLALAGVIFVYAKGRESVLVGEDLYWDFFPILPALAVWFALNVIKAIKED